MLVTLACFTVFGWSMVATLVSATQTIAIELGLGLSLAILFGQDSVHALFGTKFCG